MCHTGMFLKLKTQKLTRCRDVDDSQDWRTDSGENAVEISVLVHFGLDFLPTVYPNFLKYARGKLPLSKF